MTSARRKTGKSGNKSSYRWSSTESCDGCHIVPVDFEGFRICSKEVNSF